MLIVICMRVDTYAYVRVCNSNHVTTHLLLRMRLLSLPKTKLGSRRIKTEFLVQLDGAASGNSDVGLLIVGATNRQVNHR